MRKLFFVSVLLVGIFSVFGQNYSAMILSLSGEGIITRNQTVMPIELPQSYFPGDVLTVKNGQATIMLFSGEEIDMSAISNYTIPSNSGVGSSELSEMANANNTSLLSQSGTAYRIRGKSNVFPTKSKILDINNAVLRFAFEDMEGLSINLKIIDSKTQKLIYYKKAISDSTVSLADAPLIAGRSYYWTLENTPTGKPELGTIVVSKPEQGANLPKLDNLDSHFRNINLISSYYNKQYFFEAYNLINACFTKYPNYTIYKRMLENLILE